MFAGPLLPSHPTRISTSSLREQKNYQMFCKEESILHPYCSRNWRGQQAQVGPCIPTDGRVPPRQMGRSRGICPSPSSACTKQQSFLILHFLAASLCFYKVILIQNKEWDGSQVYLPFLCATSPSIDILHLTCVAFSTWRTPDSSGWLNINSIQVYAMVSIQQIS